MKHSEIRSRILCLVGALIVCFVISASASPTVSFTKVLAGSNLDVANAVAMDSAGNAYVTGFTASNNFPLALASISSFQGQNDAFLTKLSPSGAVLFSTYWGGSGSDFATGIAVDSTGVYITGYTNSVNFPGHRIGPLNGQYHAFVSKFSLTGQEIYSVVLGGSCNDGAYAIAVDSSHAAYITGFTCSPDFPIFGSWQTQKNSPSGLNDAFVAKVDPWGNLVDSAYIRGGLGLGIAVDGSGSVWVTGTTRTTTGRTIGPQAGNVFVAGISAAFDGFIFSTEFGSGGSQTFGRAIAVNAGFVYVAGTVDVGVPTTPGAFQSSKPSSDLSAFVTMLNPSSGPRFGTSLGSIVYSTYLDGPNGQTWANAIAVHGAGDIYVAGTTSSTNFPGAPNQTGGFLVKFTPQLNAVNYTEIFGGSINGVAVYQPYLFPGRPTYPQVYTAGTNGHAFVVRLDETPVPTNCCAVLP
jgi:hypothetical protein